MPKSENVPKLMQDKFDSLSKLTDAFCQQSLNEEYQQLIRSVIAALCRKRPSPLLRGRESTWASGIVHAIGMANFLFDKSQTPNCTASDISSYFGVASSTSGNKSKEIREMLKINHFSADWTLPSRLKDSPTLWLIQVNGLIVDARTMPLDIQEAAYSQGLIPYVPEVRD